MEQAQPLVIERVPVDSIMPWPNNPNDGDVDSVAESIAEFEQYVPIVVQRSSGRIVKGNTTYRALIRSGAEHVDVVFREWDDTTAQRVLVGDNRHRDRAKTHEDRLADLLSDLAEADALAGTGFDADYLDDLLDSLRPPEIEQPEPAVQASPKPVSGDVVDFRCGDYSGKISRSVYDVFVGAYEQQREQTGEVMLDDVLVLWLGIAERPPA